MGMRRLPRRGQSKGEKSESANVVLQTKRMKDLSRKKKGVRVEETTTMASIDKPIRENYSWTDEN